MKKPHLMSMDELMALPIFGASGALDRVDVFGGCFRDREGVLWGTGLIEDPWQRYPAAWTRFSPICFAMRHGLSSDQLTRPGSLRGFIDRIDDASANGWAQDLGEPDASVTIDLTVNGRVLARMHADRLRPDLADFGIGDGRHGFDGALSLPSLRGETQIVVALHSYSNDVVDVAVVRPRA